MLPTNKDIRQFLISEYGEEKGNAVVLFPEYADSFDGITMDGHVIYNISKACISRAFDRHITLEEAMYEVCDELKRLCDATGSKAPVINTGSPFKDSDNELSSDDVVSLNRISNDEIRKVLISEYGEEEGNSIVLFPEYVYAFEGIALDGRIIYKLRKICISRALDRHITLEEAMYEVCDELKRLCDAAGSKAPVIDVGTPFKD